MQSGCEEETREYQGCQLGFVVHECEFLLVATWIIFDRSHFRATLLPPLLPTGWVFPNLSF